MEIMAAVAGLAALEWPSRVTVRSDSRYLVDAVMQADQSLQTVMAVRDKLVSAFLAITKMQI